MKSTRERERKIEYNKNYVKTYNKFFIFLSLIFLPKPSKIQIEPSNKNQKKKKNLTSKFVSAFSNMFLGKNDPPKNFLVIVGNICHYGDKVSTNTT